MPTMRMHLKVLLPFEVFADMTDVSRIVAETHEGSFGLLPRRRDCVAALEPGILLFESDADGEVFVAVDEGILVKTGSKVLVAVRGALGGSSLATLRDAVQQQFRVLDDDAQTLRTAMAKLESGFVRRFVSFQDE